ncbi:MAG: hypothetical protein OXH86_17910 [Acidimicrobiaceae bacterium]|nr:hypothetical protein [Acidimicrobiaceae bacterium]MDE0320446.1 hypothetical protein [Acidimicrobiaceae bacterium]MDE0499217.1 hypothetical protein [Acidimicrobiaceae bacterium]
MDELVIRRWDPVESLKTPADAAAYLEAALEDGDPELVAAVIGDIARAAAESDTLQRSAMHK